MTVKLSDLGNSLGTREEAKRIRDKIMESSEIVTLDFENISIVSNSFADELLGIIVRDFGFEKLKEKVVLANTNSEVQLTIKKAIVTRM